MPEVTAMPRVALLTYDDSPPEGGQGVYVRDLRAALAAQEIRVTTISGRGDHAIPFTARTRRAPLDFSWHVSRHPGLLNGYDLIHLQGGPGGVLLPGGAGAPMVVTAHHTYRQAYSRRSARRPLGLLEARTYRHARRILAVSASTAAAIRGMGISARAVEVLAPGVHVPPQPDESRRVPGRILFVGRLEREKGVLDAMSVMAAVARSRPGVTGHVIGRGRLSDEVRDRAARNPAVSFLGGVDDERLAAERAEAEVVLVPSQYEGLGLVALEAMAAGCAVVAFDVVGLRDAALGVARLLPHGDLAGMAAMTTALLTDPAQRADLGARGRAAVIEHHSWARHADRVAALYREVLDG